MAETILPLYASFALGDLTAQGLDEVLPQTWTSSVERRSREQDGAVGAGVFVGGVAAQSAAISAVSGLLGTSAASTAAATTAATEAVAVGTEVAATAGAVAAEEAITVGGAAAAGAAAGSAGAVEIRDFRWRLARRLGYSRRHCGDDQSYSIITPSMGFGRRSSKAWTQRLSDRQIIGVDEHVRTFAIGPRNTTRS